MKKILLMPGFDTGGGSSASTGGIPQVDVATEGYSSSATFTRPSNTTAYTAGDAVGAADGSIPANAGSAILTFASIGPSAGVIMITDVELEVRVSALPATMAGFRLHLYNASPDAILDNAAWDLSSAGDRGKYLGSVVINPPVDLGSTLYVKMTQVNAVVKLSATSLYGVLVTDAAFTPTSGAVKKVTLHAVSL